MKIGIDLGGSHIAVGVVENGNIQKQKQQEIGTKTNIEAIILKGIEDLIDQILEEQQMKIEQIEAIGIAAPGIIENGTIVKAGNLNLYNFPIVDKLRKIYEKTEITLKNDGKCAALAEKKYGCMKEFQDGIFMNIGTGIGGAVFINHQLLEPKKSAGFELGHVTIEKNGKMCTCGKKGCFETYCSIQSLKERVQKEMDISKNMTGKELWEIISIHKEEKMRVILEEYIENLAVGLANFIDIFEPEIICFGGSFVNYKPFIMPKLQEKLQEPNRLFSKSTLPVLEMAQLKNDAGMIGAV